MNQRRQPESGPQQSLFRYRPEYGYEVVPDALPRRIRVDAEGMLWGEVPVVPVVSVTPPEEPRPRTGRSVEVLVVGERSSHGSAAGARRRPQAVPDLPGHDLKPDPLLAATPAEFIETMRRYRRWAGEPSFREMNRRVEFCSAAAFCATLRGDQLPKYSVLNAFVVACGGSEEDFQRWVTAWRRLDQNGEERPTMILLPPKD
ncbi:hypothetical protein [Nocardiopsis sp. CA-288880]|uniref:hypothetical protein n=1 Tax=Nocardiopsis sp. CA-288880 TaxID=3239995 RepID=UPI003D98751D